MELDYKPGIAFVKIYEVGEIRRGKPVYLTYATTKSTTNIKGTLEFERH